MTALPVADIPAIGIHLAYHLIQAGNKRPRGNAPHLIDKSVEHARTALVREARALEQPARVALLHRRQAVAEQHDDRYAARGDPGPLQAGAQGILQVGPPARLEPLAAHADPRLVLLERFPDDPRARALFGRLGGRP